MREISKPGKNRSLESCSNIFFPLYDSKIIHFLGKFSQNSNFTSNVIVNDQESLEEFYANAKLEVTSANLIDDENLQLTYKSKDPYRKPSRVTNCIIGIRVTSLF